MLEDKQVITLMLEDKEVNVRRGTVVTYPLSLAEGGELRVPVMPPAPLPGAVPETADLVRPLRGEGKSC